MPLIFDSQLSWEQIEENFENVDFFESLIQSLEEANAYAAGEDTGALVHPISCQDCRERTFDTVEELFEDLDRE